MPHGETGEPKSGGEQWRAPDPEAWLRELSGQDANPAPAPEASDPAVPAPEGVPPNSARDTRIDRVLGDLTRERAAVGDTPTVVLGRLGGPDDATAAARIDMERDTAELDDSNLEGLLAESDRLWEQAREASARLEEAQAGGGYIDSALVDAQRKAQARADKAWHRLSNVLHGAPAEVLTALDKGRFMPKTGLRAVSVDTQVPPADLKAVYLALRGRLGAVGDAIGKYNKLSDKHPRWDVGAVLSHLQPLWENPNKKQVVCRVYETADPYKAMVVWHQALQNAGEDHGAKTDEVEYDFGDEELGPVLSLSLVELAEGPDPVRLVGVKNRLNLSIDAYVKQMNVHQSYPVPQGSLRRDNLAEVTAASERAMRAVGINPDDARRANAVVKAHEAAVRAAERTGATAPPHLPLPTPGSAVGTGPAETGPGYIPTGDHREASGVRSAVPLGGGRRLDLPRRPGEPPPLTRRQRRAAAEAAKAPVPAASEGVRPAGSTESVDWTDADRRGVEEALRIPWPTRARGTASVETPPASPASRLRPVPPVPDLPRDRPAHTERGDQMMAAIQGVHDEMARDAPPVSMARRARVVAGEVAARAVDSLARRSRTVENVRQSVRDFRAATSPVERRDAARRRAAAGTAAGAAAGAAAPEAQSPQRAGAAEAVASLYGYDQLRGAEAFETEFDTIQALPRAAERLMRLRELQRAAGIQDVSMRVPEAEGEVRAAGYIGMAANRAEAEVKRAADTARRRQGPVREPVSPSELPLRSAAPERRTPAAPEGGTAQAASVPRRPSGEADGAEQSAPQTLRSPVAPETAADMELEYAKLTTGNDFMRAYNAIDEQYAANPQGRVARLEALREALSQRRNVVIRPGRRVDTAGRALPRVMDGREFAQFLQGEIERSRASGGGT